MAAGVLDQSYGKGGIAVLVAPEVPRIEASEPSSVGLLLAPEGRAFVSGGTYGRGAFVFGLEPNGAPIRGFGQDGVVRESPTMPSDAHPIGLAIGPGGRIDVAAKGEPIRVRSESFMLTFRRDGSLNTSVGAGSGKLPASPLEIPVLPPIADGRHHFLAIRESRPASVVRFGPNGLARGYGTEGRAVLPRGFTAIQLLHAKHGRLFVIGKFPGETGFAVVALGPGGSLDSRYGRGGVARLRIGKPRDTSVASGVARPDGSLLLVGQIGGAAGAVRLLPDGAIDRRFGRDGRTVILGHHTVATGAIRQGSETVITCSREYDGHRRGSILVGLESDGRAEPTFGKGGSLYASRTSVPLAAFASGSDLILVTALKPGQGGGVVVRGYRPSGLPDPTFGVRGTAIAARRQRQPFRAIAAMPQAEGKIVVLGSVGHGLFRQRAELLRFR